MVLADNMHKYSNVLCINIQKQPIWICTNLHMNVVLCLSEILFYSINNIYSSQIQIFFGPCNAIPVWIFEWHLHNYYLLFFWIICLSQRLLLNGQRSVHAHASALCVSDATITAEHMTALAGVTFDTHLLPPLLVPYPPFVSSHPLICLCRLRRCHSAQTRCHSSVLCWPSPCPYYCCHSYPSCPWSQSQRWFDG